MMMLLPLAMVTLYYLVSVDKIWNFIQPLVSSDAHQNWRAKHEFTNRIVVLG